ncbi:MAG: hypothetical protein NC548_06420 [Lachnospiraceae bacterium]|nr:hypothetical protein [Lachnospiraceae bacterium]
MQLVGSPGNEKYSFADFDYQQIEEEERENLETLREEAQEAIKEASSVSPDSIPAFIWEPMINEFDDGIPYVALGMNQQNPVVGRVANMLKKYDSYYDYIDALEVWYEYYDYICAQFGSFESFAYAMHEGLTTLPMRVMPQLKKKSKNRALAKCNVAISRIIPEDMADVETIAYILEGMEPNYEEVEVDFMESDSDWEKVNRPIIRALEQQQRVQNARRYSTVQADPQRDALMQFLRTQTSETFGGIHQEGSLMDEVEAMHEFDFEIPDLIEDALYGSLPNGGRAIHLDGRLGMYTKKDTEEMMELYKAMAEAGFDVQDVIASSGMSKQSQKLIQNQIGTLTGQYSDKELKKLAKKRKKAEKAFSDRMHANEAVRAILTKNRINFDRNDDALSFTMSDILGGLINP